MRKQIKYRLLVYESDRIRAEKDKEAGRERSSAVDILTGDPNEDPKETTPSQLPYSAQTLASIRC